MVTGLSGKLPLRNKHGRGQPLTYKNVSGHCAQEGAEEA